MTHVGLGALVLAVGIAAPLSSQNAERALARAVDAYADVRSLEAAFVQTISNPMIGRPDSSRGVLYLVRPDRFAMRFTKPEGDRIVADGRYLWLYLPSTVPNQVVRTAIPATGTAGPNLFAQFLDRPAERYRAAYLEDRSIGGMMHDVVRLEPVEPLGFRRADLAIGRADGLIRMVDLIETSGLARRLDLSALRINLDVPPTELSFSAPAGVRVVTQP